MSTVPDIPGDSGYGSGRSGDFKAFCYPASQGIPPGSFLKKLFYQGGFLTTCSPGSRK